MNTTLILGIILVVGFFFARLIGKIKLPTVTAYIVVGIIIGPSVLGFIPETMLETSGFISNIVLGIIAFTIGQNFLRDTFKRIGRQVLFISIMEAGITWILVTLLFVFLLRQPLYISIIFGAISAATAPAATVMVVREYNAKGKFTETLLGVVAIDDAWCLVIFALSLAIARALYAHTASTFFMIKTVLNALMEIGGAFALGSCLAWVIHKLSRHTRNKPELLIYTLGFLLLNIGLALHLHLSVLLSCMSLGAVLVNLNPNNTGFFDILKSIDPPLYLIFFILAGAHLQISILASLGLLGIAYLLFRVVGKYLGALLGAQLSHADTPIKKYIGLGLIPQAGVALGVALIAKDQFPEIGGIILTVIVATTVIYEIIGPVCTKIALQKVGDIQKLPQ